MADNALAPPTGLPAVPAHTTRAPQPPLSAEARLWSQQVASMLVHANELLRVGVLSAEQHAESISALESLAEAMAGQTAKEVMYSGDLQQSIYSHLAAGNVGALLQAGVTREEERAQNLRLWTRDAVSRVDRACWNLQAALIELAERYLEWLVPTHTQSRAGQPVLVGHHYLAWFWRVQRDRQRLAEVTKRLGHSIRGSGDGSGSGLGIDPAAYATALQLPKVAENSLDAVTAIDAILEAVAVAAITAATSTALHAELRAWSRPEMGFVAFTGPHDIALATTAVHSHAAFGQLSALASEQPTRTASEPDKSVEIVVRAFDELEGLLRDSRQAIVAARLDQPALQRASARAPGLVHELTDALVTRGVAHTDAARAVMALVDRADEEGLALGALRTALLTQAHPRLEEGDASLLDANAAVRRRTAEFATAPAAVRRQLFIAKERLGSRP